MKWISCKERMPDQGQKVLFVREGISPVYSGFFEGETFFGVPTGEFRWVSHWMPAPDLPKEAT